MTRKALTLATLLPSSATSSKLRVGFEETPSVDIAIDDLNVEHNIEARRFEIHYGDEMARLEYHLRRPNIVYTHTVVPRALEGHGIAGKLAKEALDYARESGLPVVPLCPYVADYIDKHPEYADLVTREE